MRRLKLPLKILNRSTDACPSGCADADPGCESGQEGYPPLDEMLRDLETAARLKGNEELTSSLEMLTAIQENIDAIERQAQQFIRAKAQAYLEYSRNLRLRR